MQAAAAEASSAELRLSVTGTGLLLESSDEGDRGVLVEVWLGGLGALIVLALVFGSLLAAVPLVVAAVSILATFLVLLGLTTVTDVVFVVQYLVALIGLGVAIDYSLLIVMRWREERAGGLDGRAAVQVAMATAGRAVVLSGFTVVVSLAALVAVPLPFLRSIGLGGLLIPLLSVLTATTLLPVILDALGARLQWPRRAATDPTSPGWGRIALVAVRRPVVVALASTAVLLALAAPLLGLRLGSPQLSSYDTSGTAGAAAAAALEAGIPPGALRPIEVLVPDPGGAETGRATVAAIRDSAAGGGAGLGGALVGGSAAEEADFVSAVYSDAPYAILAVVVVTFLLLVRALRSLWLQIKALLLNIVSLAAAFVPRPGPRPRVAGDGGQREAGPRPGYRRCVPDRQRILVVSTAASTAELLRVREVLGRDPVVITAPTEEAKRVVRVLEAQPRVEVLLAPMSFPPVDRGHRLDELVRRHALWDRFRDVVVVTDSATSTLLLRTLAPDQLSTAGGVTEVGLVRGDRPVAVRRAVAVGLALGLAASLVESAVAVLALPGAVALVGLALLLFPPWRHLGRELLLAAAISIAVLLAVVAGSARFPGAW